MPIHTYVKAPAILRPSAKEEAVEREMNVDHTLDSRGSLPRTLMRGGNDNQRRRQRTAISYLFILAGFAILSWALWPIVAFTLFTAPLMSGVVSPVQNVAADGLASNVLSPMAAASDTQIVTSGIDYTNPNIWFPAAPQKKVVSSVTAYTVSIPKLGINDAFVIISGDDLNKSLIHYGGTGLPGEYGTAVIFGHSVLPQFYNPTNYTTIFSTLPALKTGDEIFVRYDGVVYRYIVYDMIITQPNDLTPLEQRFDDSYVTLITCVPPGTYWKRLNVRGRLEKI